MVSSGLLAERQEHPHLRAHQWGQRPAQPGRRQGQDPLQRVSAQARVPHRTHLQPQPAGHRLRQGPQSAQLLAGRELHQGGKIRKSRLHRHAGGRGGPGEVPEGGHQLHDLHGAGLRHPHYLGLGRLQWYLETAPGGGNLPAGTYRSGHY